MNAEAAPKPVPLSLFLCRAAAILNGPLFGLLVGFATLTGVSILAEALGRRTGFEVLVMSVWAAGFAFCAGSGFGIAAAVRHRSTERLAASVRALWRYQFLVLPAIVIAFTLLQLSVEPLPA